LMNNCTAAGCHGPQSTTNFKLTRVAGPSANQRVTQRNLLAALQYIDRENPEHSRLLTQPRGPHGSAKSAIFTQRQAEQYCRMSDWVMGFAADGLTDSPEPFADRPTAKNAPEEPSAEELSPPRLLSRESRNAKPLAAAKKSRGKPADALDKEVVPASYQEPPAEFLQTYRSRPAAANGSEEAVPPLESQKRLPAAQKVKRGAPLPQNGSNDPFDPEIFNRRYHASDTSPEGEKQPADAEFP
jgi:hypothetical protein